MLRFRLMVNEVRGYGLKHQKEKRSMDHFAGLDVSVKETSICIVDDTRPDRLGVSEACGHVDGGAVGQRHHRSDTRDRHQTPAHLIVSHDGQQTAMQVAELL